MEDELNIELDKEDLDIILDEQNSIDAEIENSDIVPTGRTKNYEILDNKPKINNVELVGNKNANDLNLQERIEVLTNLEIEEILKM